jgi:hypothetical protein
MSDAGLHAGKSRKERRELTLIAALRATTADGLLLEQQSHHAGEQRAAVALHGADTTLAAVSGASRYVTRIRGVAALTCIGV